MKRTHHAGSVRFLAVASVWLVLSTTACFSYQRLGDRSFDEGNCAEALEYYEQAFTEGFEDADTYHRAARCALRGGDFSTAERYYNKALSHGAGVPVAKEFAEFYIKTSNYASAVQLYQYLLYYEDDKQPVYNNLGTALMYAERPFDAESYLMVAHQMNPRDPRPYLNLGVLYDRHLRQPWLAISFYQCFGQLAPGSENAALVKQRIEELMQRWSRLYDPQALTCGQPFQPPPPEPVADLSESVEAQVANETINLVEESEPTTASDDASGGEGDSTEAVVIERLVTEDIPTTPTDAAASAASEGDALALARRAYEEKNWAETISRLSSVPIARLETVHFEMMGIAYLRQNNWGRAKHWLELAVEGDDKPDTVHALITAHRKAGNVGRAAALCRTFGNRPEHEALIKDVCTIDPPEVERSEGR